MGGCCEGTGSGDFAYKKAYSLNIVCIYAPYTTCEYFAKYASFLLPRSPFHLHTSRIACFGPRSLFPFFVLNTGPLSLLPNSLLSYFLSRANKAGLSGNGCGGCGYFGGVIVPDGGVGLVSGARRFNGGGGRCDFGDDGSSRSGDVDSGDRRGGEGGVATNSARADGRSGGVGSVRSSSMFLCRDKGGMVAPLSSRGGRKLGVPRLHYRIR